MRKTKIGDNLEAEYVYNGKPKRSHWDITVKLTGRRVGYVIWDKIHRKFVLYFPHTGVILDTEKLRALADRLDRIKSRCKK